MSGPLGLAGAGGYKVELQTKVHTKVRNHEEGPYLDLLLVESAYKCFYI